MGLSRKNKKRLNAFGWLLGTATLCTVFSYFTGIPRAEVLAFCALGILFFNLRD